MPRGGRRQGLPGKNYQNRTDLGTAPRKLPVQTPTGQPYGQAKEIEDSQRIVPMARPGVDVSNLPSLDAPTERPEEPLTSGVDLGPGVGREALNIPDPRDEDLSSLKRYLPTLEMISALPDSSSMTRNFVRRVRGAMPLPQMETDFTD